MESTAECKSGASDVVLLGNAAPKQRIVLGFVPESGGRRSNGKVGTLTFGCNYHRPGVKTLWQLRKGYVVGRVPGLR